MKMRTDVQKKGVFKSRVHEWAQKLDATVVSITIKPMKNKWASCSTKGRLTFEASLLDFSIELQDYVIVHELLHFHIPNHGPLWKSLMRAHLGEYEGLERELRKRATCRTCN